MVGRLYTSRNISSKWNNRRIYLLNEINEIWDFIWSVANDYWLVICSNIMDDDIASSSVGWWHPTLVLLPGKSHGQRSLVGCSPWGREESDTTEQLHVHALEKEMATHSSVFAWRIPGTGEPGRLPSMGSHRVRHDWSDLAAAAASNMLPQNSLG